MHMKHALALLLVSASVSLFAVQAGRAQTCKDDESMVTTYKQTLNDSVNTVRKESLQDFVREFHQKSVTVQVNLSLNLVNQLVTCLDKAAQDSTATKDEIAAYKAKRETYAKLKGALSQDLNELKAENNQKQAKAVIEKFDFSK